jgi:asparagine N-glycosylation enzyme membrane subunit Stt3
MAYLDKSIAAEFDGKYPILMDSSGMPSAAEATDMLDPTMLLFQGIMEKETTSKSERAAHRDAAISEVLLLISLAVLSYSGYYYYFLILLLFLYCLHSM